jgi:hypothetical protein
MRNILKKYSLVGAFVLIIGVTGILFSTVVKHLPGGSYAAVYASILVSNTNQARETALGGGQLTTNPLLTQAAQLVANDMATKSYFAHINPDGKTPWYWLNQVGYNYNYAGENLAVNFVDSTDVSNAWMASPTHRANILNPVFKEIGIATAVGTYQGRSAIFVVQFFGTPSGPVATTTPAVTSQAADVLIGATSPILDAAISQMEHLNWINQSKGAILEGINNINQ